VQFGAALEDLVVPDSQADARAFTVLMESHPGYTGRMHRPERPALIVRARPINGSGAGCVVMFIEEQMTSTGKLAPPGS